jgi:hypothetical protein
MQRTLGTVIGRSRASFAVVLAVWMSGCAHCVPCKQDSHGGPVVLRGDWMIGIEPVVGDANPLLPYTNRLLTDLAAMPKIQVIYAGSERNAWPFQAQSGQTIGLAPWLHGDGQCMTANYVVRVSGQETGRYSLITPRLTAGTESDIGCVDRFATGFYLALVRQGF